MSTTISRVLIAVFGSVALMACSPSGSTADAAPQGDGGAVSQTPPMGSTAVEAWLAHGDYRRCDQTHTLHQ